MAFKDRLKALRIESGLSQNELADRLNISSGSIGNYESGIRKPTEEAANALANFFGVEIADLLHGPQLTSAQYDALCTKLSAVLDNTSSDDLEAMEIPEAAIRSAIRQRIPIREDRAKELAEQLQIRIDDILSIKDELDETAAHYAFLQKIYDKNRILFDVAADATPEELQEIQKYVEFVKSRR